jgi:hypothetical protein
MMNNKALWIFQNIKESVDILPPRLRGQAWEMIINYGFGDENVEQNCKNLKVLLTFRVVKPLLRLRGIAGSQNGKSNNPSGLAKNKEPNIGVNIDTNITPIPLITKTVTETITENKEEKYRFEGKVIKLNYKDYYSFTNEYPHIDLDRELEGLDRYYSDNNITDWWLRCKNRLRTKEAKAKEESGWHVEGSNW